MANRSLTTGGRQTASKTNTGQNETRNTDINTNT